LAAAIAAARTGSTDVALTPGGCATIHRDLRSGKAVSQTLVIEGVTVANWQLAADNVHVDWDLDRDGFAETRIDSRVHGGQRQQVQYDPKTHVTLGRRVVTDLGTDDQVEIQTPVSNGQDWNTATAYISSHDEDYSRALVDPSTAPAAELADASCTPAQVAHLASVLQHAYDTGMECLNHYNSELTTTLAFQLIVRDVDFGCTYTACRAHLDPLSYRDETVPIHIDVDWPCFSNLSDYEQASVVWHELMHLLLGGHDGNNKGFPRYSERDRVVACERLCFGPNDYTKCTCATCLGANTCDSRCKQLSDCDDSYGFRCPCRKGPNAGKLFTKCSQCLAVCPSGLACFGTSTCTAEYVGCGTPPTCP
jgi:hypothetical protein